LKGVPKCINNSQTNQENCTKDLFVNNWNKKLNTCTNDSSSVHMENAVISNLPKEQKLPMINPNVKKYLVSQLTKDTSKLQSLENELSNTMTYVNNLKTELTNLSNNTNIDEISAKNLEKPTDADIQKGKFFKFFSNFIIIF